MSRNVELSKLAVGCAVLALSASLAVADPVRLIDAALGVADVVRFDVSGDRAVAVARVDPSGEDRLFSIPVHDPSSATLLTDPTDPLGSISFIEKPDDPSGLLYSGEPLGDPQADARYFKAPIDGSSTPIELSAIERRAYYDADLTEPDFSYEYLVRDDQNGVAQIYRAPLFATGPEIQLTNHASASSVQGLDLIGGSDRLIFRSDTRSDGVYEYLSVPTDGTQEPVVLGPQGVTTSALGQSTTSDGETAIVRTLGGGTNYMQPLFAMPTDGSSEAQLLSHAPDIERVNTWQLTPDESRVLYISRSNAGRFNGGLYSVPLQDPAGRFKISSPARNSSTAVYGARIDDSGERVVYDGFLNTSTSVDLFSASTTQPNTQIQLNTRNVAHGDVSSVKLIQGGERVVYRGDMNTRAFYELYSADTDAEGTQIRISGPVASNATSIFGYALSPNEEWAVYTKTSPGRTFRDLFAASTSLADSERTLITQEFYGRSQGSEISPNSDFVVAVVSATSTTGVFREHLFAVPQAGGVPVRLNDRLPERGRVTDFQFTEDGESVVFTAATDVYQIGERCDFGFICPPWDPVPIYGQDSDLYLSDLPVGGGVLGDMDGDGEIDSEDVDAFALGILSPQTFAFEFGLPPVNFGDLNRDGLFDLSDVGPFAEILGQPSYAVRSVIAKAGDYNNDGIVDAADYGAWRDARDAPQATLPNDVLGGVIGDGQYAVWMANFGNLWSASPPGVTVPEPGSLLIVALISLIFHEADVSRRSGASTRRPRRMR